MAASGCFARAQVSSAAKLSREMERACVMLDMGISVRLMRVFGEVGGLPAS